LHYKYYNVSSLNVFYDKIGVKNDIDLLDRVLQVYAILNFEDANKLVPAQRKILLYYVRNGLTKETLENVITDTGYSRNYLHTVNKALRDKGYLVKDKNNEHKFYLNSELEHIRKKFVVDKAKGYIISFDKTN